MTESFTQYYGADWAAPALTFASLYLLGQKHRAGFLLGIVACGCWIVMGLMVNSIPQIIANLIFMGLNLRGYLLWGKDKKD